MPARREAAATLPAPNTGRRRRPAQPPSSEFRRVTRSQARSPSPVRDNEEVLASRLTTIYEEVAGPSNYQPPGPANPETIVASTQRAISPAMTAPTPMPPALRAIIGDGGEAEEETTARDDSTQGDIGSQGLGEPRREEGEQHVLRQYIELLRETQSMPVTADVWTGFEVLVGEIVSSVRLHLRIEERPRGAGLGRRTVDPSDPKTIQRVYKLNRRKAIRLITQSPHIPCDLPVDTLSRRLVGEDEGEWDPQVLDGVRVAEEAVVMTNFTPEEVKDRLRKFENSAPGEDGIDYRAWKRVDPEGKLLCHIYNICLKHRRVPAEWKSSRTIFLPKVDCPQEVSDWRPIALSRTIYKIYAGLLSDRISSWCRAHEVLSPHQKGFTAHDGVFEHNYVLEQRMAAARMKREDLCVAWLDISDAFGSIPHACVTGALAKRGVGERLVAIIRDIYQGQVKSISVPSGQSGTLHIRKGIKQGCPLSGLLFIIGINHVMEALDAGEQHRVLAYADDIALLARSPQELQELIDRARTELRKLGLHLNPAKCKTMHLSGSTPVGVRDTDFSLEGSRLTALKEGEVQRFLGHPVGFKAVPPQAEIEEVVGIAKKILGSALAPWQRLDALRKFVYPALNFPMRKGCFLKKDWAKVDDIIRADIKRTLGVPQEASNDYLYGARSEGLCGIPIAAEESDLALIDGAFKLLTSKDEKLRRMAVTDLKDSVRSRTLLGHQPDPESFLSGLVTDGMRDRSCQVSDPWTRGRTASKRVGVQWTFQEETPTLTFRDATVRAPERHRLLRTLKRKLQEERGEKLRQKLSQGRVAECLKDSPDSSHFLYTGDYLSFADWRFIHKARLQLLPLNGCKRWGDQEKRCRRCGFANECAAHVVGQCNAHMVLRQRRHDAIVDRVEETAKNRGWAVIGKNQAVDDSRLRPDLVVTKGDKALIIDVTVPFENRKQAFQSARVQKEEKYEPVKSSLRPRYREVKIAPIIVGALGTWDPLNDQYLKGLSTRAYLKKMRRLITCETISWSRCMYMEHLSGRIQRPYRWTRPTEDDQQEEPAAVGHGSEGSNPTERVTEEPAPRDPVPEGCDGGTAGRVAAQAGGPGPSPGAPVPPTEGNGTSTERSGPSTEEPGPPTKGPGTSTEGSGQSTEEPGPPIEGPGPADERPEPSTREPGPSDEGPDPADGRPRPSEDEVMHWLHHLSVNKDWGDDNILCEDTGQSVNINNKLETLRCFVNLVEKDV